MSTPPTPDTDPTTAGAPAPMPIVGPGVLDDLPQDDEDTDDDVWEEDEEDDWTDEDDDFEDEDEDDFEDEDDEDWFDDEDDADDDRLDGEPADEGDEV